FPRRGHAADQNSCGGSRGCRKTGGRLMMITEVIFAVLVAITLIGAILAVALKNVFYNALALILSLFGVATLFIYLNGEFLAIIEVIVYIGAISIAIIFAIMLSRPMLRSHEPRNAGKVMRSGILGLLL